MEYIIIGSIAIAVFIFLFLIIKVEKLRNIANALFLEAEKLIEENENRNKFEYVCSNIYIRLPNILKLFISVEFLQHVIQMIYNRTRLLAKDLLDDGKRNKSV